MKISVNDQELYTLSDTQKNVIKHVIQSEIFDADMKRRVQWVLIHLYDECFKSLKQEWDIKLADSGVSMIPTDRDAYAQLVFSHPDYKNRSMRESEAQLQR